MAKNSSYFRVFCPYKSCGDRIFHMKPAPVEGEITWCPYCTRPIVFRDQKAEPDLKNPIQRHFSKLPWHGGAQNSVPKVLNWRH